MRLKIRRCENMENSDTCIPFTVVKTEKTCEMVNSEDDFWSTFVRKCQNPQLICPFKKVCKKFFCLLQFIQ